MTNQDGLNSVFGNKCAHKWVKSGIWDGKNEEGEKTGGIVYKCQICDEKAYSIKEVEDKGGTIDETTDVFGKKKA